MQDIRDPDDEARVLLELGAAQHLLRPGALAKQLNLQPSTLSRVLRNLENRGFIERHRTTEDARSLSLSLTYLGARTAKETEQTLDRFFDGLGKHLGYERSSEEDVENSERRLFHVKHKS